MANKHESRRVMPSLDLIKLNKREVVLNPVLRIRAYELLETGKKIFIYESFVVDGGLDCEKLLLSLSWVEEIC